MTPTTDADPSNLRDFDIHRPYTAASSSTPSISEPLPPYGAAHEWHFADPRSSSQQSLVPSQPDSHDKRTLLVIYIHGFNGNSQSFRSFPAHVHGYLKDALSDTHNIHTKLYPRYKTYKAVEVARDKFSEWLKPHEGPNTDVILVGHSMGGILAAEIILLPNQDPRIQYPFKHRILGHVSLDCPFLGLHPGIIISGIASLFQSTPKPSEDPTYVQPLGSQSTLALDTASPAEPLSPATTASSGPTLPPRPQRPDPFFNPPFFNDKTYEERPFVQGVFSFIKKHHAEGVAKSVRNRLYDQLEFGSCLANYSSLHDRYKRVRALEDVDEVVALSQGHPAGSHARVRFVNYYTLSSGVPKKPKTPKAEESRQASDRDELSVESPTSPHSSRRSSISITVTGPGGQDQVPQASTHDDVVGKSNASDKVAGHAVDTNTGRTAESKQETSAMEDRLSYLSMQDLDPVPMSDSEESCGPSTDNKQKQSLPADDSLPQLSQPPSEDSSLQKVQSPTEELQLPPLPPEPSEPDLPDLAQFTDKAARKQAEKESKRLQKAYESALKDRAKAVREREKLIEKRRKDSLKAQEKQDRQAKKEVDTHEKREKQRLEKEQLRMEKERLRMEKEAAKLQKKTAGSVASLEQSDGDEQYLGESAGADRAPEGQEEEERLADEAQKIAPKKSKKFCTLPNKVNGQMDETWVDVYMDGMSEVTAHCGLFFSGPHYDKLIGDVGSRIVAWVQDDLTKRAIMEMPVD